MGEERDRRRLNANHGADGGKRSGRGRTGGIAREQLRVVKGKDMLFVWGDADGPITGTVGRAT